MGRSLCAGDDLIGSLERMFALNSNMRGNDSNLPMAIKRSVTIMGPSVMIAKRDTFLPVIRSTLSLSAKIAAWFSAKARSYYWITECQRVKWKNNSILYSSYLYELRRYSPGIRRRLLSKYSLRTALAV